VRVLVAMSGGVDSSVAAARVVEAGHEAVGVTRPETDDAPRPARYPPRARHPREQAKRLFPSRDFH